jgi:hypothetical protein
MFLDQVKQVFLGLKLMVEACQGHSRGAGKISHGSAFITFLTKDMGGMVQQFGQPSIKAGVCCLFSGGNGMASFATVKGLAS